MPKRDWELIRELVTALGSSNTPRTIPRTIGEALAKRWATRRVRLVLSRPKVEEIYEARFVGGKFVTQLTSGKSKKKRSSSAPSVSLSKLRTRIGLPLQLSNGTGDLTIWCGTTLPILDDPTYLGTLVRLVEVGLNNQDLVQRVANLSQRAHVENRQLRDSLAMMSGGDNIIANSPQMKAIMARVRMVARYDTSVLIQGPSGTGKELVSREIHRRSSRCRKSFIQINCGAIPSQLIESELFGHEEGAFTGASRLHRGVFEQAHLGVLLLDEVGDLPLDAQVKLLRVLQEGRIRRVGAETEIKVDVRVVAATNRDLTQMVRNGEFREDLYFRLSVFPIEIPPLRERPEDIAPLVRHLLRGLSAKLGTQTPTLSNQVLSNLKAHTWPGNIRELANVLEAAIILGQGRSLELPADFGTEATVLYTSANEPRLLDDVIHKAIESALSASRGKVYGIGGAAEALGLHPATLQSKMRKLGIQRDVFTMGHRDSELE